MSHKKHRVDFPYVFRILEILVSIHSQSDPIQIFKESNACEAIKKCNLISCPKCDKYKISLHFTSITQLCSYTQ